MSTSVILLHAATSLNNGIPTYTNIVFRLLEEIDLLLKNFVYNGYSALSSYMSIPLGVIAALYIVILGYAVMLGQVRLSVRDLIKSVLKIAFIYVAVTNWSWFSEYFVGLINSAISEIGSALVSATPVHIPGLGGIDGAMQTVLIQFTRIGSAVFNTGGLTNLGGIFDGLLIWGFGYLITAIALFEIILSKVMLAVLFIFAPLMVAFCFFAPLRKVFDRWIGAIVGFALLQLFVTAAVGLTLSLAYDWTAAYIGAAAIHIGNFGTLPIVVIGIINIGLIWKASHLATNLGGDACASSSSAMVAGLVGGVVGSAFTGLRLLRNLGKGARPLADVARRLLGGSGKINEAESMMKDVGNSLQGGE